MNDRPDIESMEADAAKPNAWSSKWPQADFLLSAPVHIKNLIAYIRKLESRLAQYEGRGSGDYLVLSTKWTRGEQIVWWGPNRGGYYTSIRAAGRYSKQEAEEIARTCRPDAVAIPLAEALKHAYLSVPTELSIFEAYMPRQKRA